MTKVTDLRWITHPPVSLPLRHVPEPDRVNLARWFVAHPRIAAALSLPPRVVPRLQAIPVAVHTNPRSGAAATAAGREPRGTRPAQAGGSAIPAQVISLHADLKEQWPPHLVPDGGLDPSVRRSGKGQPGVWGWPSLGQDLLVQEMVGHWRWYTGGRHGDDPNPYPDPPPPMPQWPPDQYRATLSPMHVLWLYVKTVANSLVVEQLGLTPWSLEHLTDDELLMLFAGSMFINSNNDGTVKTNEVGYELSVNHVIPPPPVLGVRFLSERGLPCADPVKSIGMLLRWCRRLQHAYTELTNEYWSQSYWGYAGTIPATRMMNGWNYDGGTEGTPPKWGYFTSGCHATVDLLRALLRLINLPVQRVYVRDLVSDGIHAAARFPVPRPTGLRSPREAEATALYLTHGDDPYFIPALLPFAPEGQFIPSAHFHQLFTGSFAGGNAVVPASQKTIDWSSRKLSFDPGSLNGVWAYFGYRVDGMTPDQALAATFSEEDLPFAIAADTGPLFEGYIADRDLKDSYALVSFSIDLFANDEPQ